MSLRGQVDAGEPTEREYAAMAEKLGQKLKASLNGGKSQLLKVLKVRARLTSHAPFLLVAPTHFLTTEKNREGESCISFF